MHETPRPEDTKSQTGDKWAPLLGFLTLILLFATLSSVFLRQRLAVWTFLVLGIASLITFLILKRQAVFRFFVSRQVRYGTNVGVAILLVTGIAVIANVIVAPKVNSISDNAVEGNIIILGLMHFSVGQDAPPTVGCVGPNYYLSHLF